MTWNKPFPYIDEDNAPFYEGAKQHKFMMFRCKECGDWYWPKAYCRNHANKPMFGNMEWAEASGKGKVFTFGIVHEVFHPGFKDDVPYVFATAAHRVKLTDWQDVDTMSNPEILEFMKKVSYQGLPEYEEGLRKDPKSRGGIVEVVARGKIFREERTQARGTPFTDVNITDEELVEKFRDNTYKVLPKDKPVDRFIKQMRELENVKNVSELMQELTI